MSDVEDYSTSGEDDSQGSLVDFIVDDDEISEVDGEEESGSDDEEEEKSSEEEDGEIVCQYHPSMEQVGIVTNPQGLRRSTRRNKGCPPSYYVDEDMAALMTEDVGSDIEMLLSHGDDSGGEDDSSEEFEMEVEEEE